MSSDAAHLALPFAGECANLVMYDGAELSKAIAASLGDTEAALLACKSNLFPPSASAAVEADRDLKLCFGNNATQSQLDLFTNNQPIKQLPYKEGKERLMEGTAPRERNGIAIRSFGLSSSTC
jgi:2-polyprenyl-6-methoxyphenol hydroxylase-like FAD-dependent oxidoreductase